MVRTIARPCLILEMDGVLEGFLEIVALDARNRQYGTCLQSNNFASQIF